LQPACGMVCLYLSGPASATGQTPILLVHSINASASAFEVAPLYDHYRQTRPTYAVDLPGFGLSDRSDRAYTIRLMTDALLAALAHIRSLHGGVAVDLLAVSLSAEYAARAACEAPDAVRRLALVSPTGFSRAKRHYGAPGSSRGIAWLRRLVSNPAWSLGLFNALTRPAVIRYFLERTWGSKKIDEALWRYDMLTTRQPGAKHAPLYFLSAYLFAADINTLYEKLACPVWVSMATRGDFTDYRGRSTVDQRANWQFHLIEGGALPYFEDLPAFIAKIDGFWAG
jgi:pimeloyl-ACP methyl ester carboxylesterase